MGQINRLFRRVEGGFGHWCPGCEEMHVITSAWEFDGNLESPTFSPSIRITGKQTIKINSEWVGDWVRDAQGNPVDLCCHYFLIAGQLQFCGDSTHALAGQTIPLPELPPYLRDNQEFFVEVIETVSAQDQLSGAAIFSVDVGELCEAKSS